MVQNIFLTDHRRNVLNGDHDLTDNSLANEKSRIRHRARMAISELQEVAQSSEIENSSVFDPKALAYLIQWVLLDPAAMTGGGVIGADDRMPDEATVDFSPQNREYQKDLHFQLSGALNVAHNPTGGIGDD